MKLLLKGVICRQLSLLLIFTGAGSLKRFIVERRWKLPPFLEVYLKVLLTGPNCGLESVTCRQLHSVHQLISSEGVICRKLVLVFILLEWIRMHVSVLKWINKNSGELSMNICDLKMISSVNKHASLLPSHCDSLVSFLSINLFTK